MLAEEAVDMGRYVSIIGSIIGWMGFIIVLAMLKGFITHAISIAVAEFLIKTDIKNEQAQRIVRWFANGDDVLATLEEIKQKVGKRN